MKAAKEAERPILGTGGGPAPVPGTMFSSNGERSPTIITIVDGVFTVCRNSTGAWLEFLGIYPLHPSLPESNILMNHPAIGTLDSSREGG
jgi:hypothetical protein